MKTSFHNIVLFALCGVVSVHCQEAPQQTQHPDPETTSLRSPWFSLRPPVTLDAASLRIGFLAPTLDAFGEDLLFEPSMFAVIDPAYEFKLSGNPINRGFLVEDLP